MLRKLCVTSSFGTQAGGEAGVWPKLFVLGYAMDTEPKEWQVLYKTTGPCEDAGRDAQQLYGDDWAKNYINCIIQTANGRKIRISQDFFTPNADRRASDYRLPSIEGARFVHASLPSISVRENVEHIQHIVNENDQAMVVWHILVDDVQTPVLLHPQRMPASRRLEVVRVGDVQTPALLDPQRRPSIDRLHDAVRQQAEGSDPGDL